MPNTRAIGNIFVCDAGRYRRRFGPPPIDVGWPGPNQQGGRLSDTMEPSFRSIRDRVASPRHRF